MGQHQGPGATGTQQVVDPNYVPTQQQPVVGQPAQQQPGRDLAAEAARFAEEHIRTPETKEFFKTSEFLVLVLGVFALSIASAVTEAIDAGRMWTMVTILTTGYLLSRGFSKSGTQRDSDAAQGSSKGIGHGPPSQSYSSGTGTGQDVAHFVEHNIRTPETKEFFKTSEFALWVLGCAGILIASAVAPDIFEATRAWALVTILSIGYMLSRGLSKAGARRGDDPDYLGRSNRVDPTGRDSGLAQLAAHVSTPETKEFFKTSEFMVWGIVTFSILLASAVVEIFNAPEAWNLISWLTAGYILSRGLAKIGTRQESGRPSGRGYTQSGAYAQSGYTQPGQVHPGQGQGYPQEQAGVVQTTPMGVQDPGHVPHQ
jgi:hypothetical protein